MDEAEFTFVEPFFSSGGVFSPFLGGKNTRPVFFCFFAFSPSYLPPCVSLRLNSVAWVAFTRCYVFIDLYRFGFGLILSGLVWFGFGF